MPSSPERAAAGAEQPFIAFLRDQLAAWAAIVPRRMFSGHGLFRGGVMFALVHGDTFYLRADAVNRPDFAARGMAPFSYRRGGRSVALGYVEVPADVLEEPDLLALWADKAYAAAQRRGAARRSRRARGCKHAGRTG